MTSQQFDRTAAISPAHFARPISQQIPYDWHFLTPKKIENVVIRIRHWIFSSLRASRSGFFFFKASRFLNFFSLCVAPTPKKKGVSAQRFPHQNPADMILKTSPRVPYQKQSRDKNEVFASNFPYQMILQKIVRWSLSPGIFPHISVHKKTCQDSHVEGLPCQDFPKIALLDTL